MTARALRLGAVGKLRSQLEYVRSYPADPAFPAFHSWLVENMDFAVRSRGAGWKSAYPASAAYALLFRPEGSSSALAGAIAPSADAAGREFPFSALALVEAASEFAPTPEVVPLLLEPIWQETSRLVLDATGKSGQASSTDPGQHIGRTRIELTSSPREATECYAHWTRTLPAAELAELLYGELGEVELSVAARLVLALRRAGKSPPTRLSLRLPLGAVGGAALCFWLDLVGRCRLFHAVPPSFFWSFDGTSGDLLLHLGRPPLTTLAELWMPGQGRDDICDLARVPPTSLAASAAAHPELDRILASGACVLELLEAIAQR
jgi:type VI secretion system ImpM family protein